MITTQQILDAINPFPIRLRVTHYRWDSEPSVNDYISLRFLVDAKIIEIIREVFPQYDNNLSIHRDPELIEDIIAYLKYKKVTFAQFVSVSVEDCYYFEILSVEHLVDVVKDLDIVINQRGGLRGIRGSKISSFLKSDIDANSK
jgi:hypothetical protein